MACYFISDVHLGDSRPANSGVERRVVEWLERVSSDAEEIFLVGDIFDFWYEYREVVPKGFTRFLSKLSELTARGIKIHFFPGNHDMWVWDYFEKECGVIIHRKGELLELYNRRVYVDHGDGVKSRTFGVTVLQKIFRCSFARRCFSFFVHPGLAMWFGHKWSAHSRKSRSEKHTFLAEDEDIVRFTREYLKGNDVDYFVFGHLHSPVKYELTPLSTLFILGAWIDDPSPVYARMTGDGITLESFEC